MKQDLLQYIAKNEYPGRGIVLGMTPKGDKAMVAYWIMGRSVNSRNRLFEAIPGGIRTVAADPAKLEDPHLIIYNPVLTAGKTTIVTNGDQTNTIYDYITGGQFPGFGFEAALNTRTFEDDGPNWTPRISGVVSHATGAYKLSILKSNEGDESSVLRQVFDYPQPIPGEGHFISTYKENGKPIPSFAGEPIRVEIPTDDCGEWAVMLWEALNRDNKVSIYTRSINLATGDVEDTIINKYKPVWR